MQSSRVSASARGRPTYKPGERAEKVRRLSTRTPAILRDHLGEVAAAVVNGYRSKGQMLSILMHRFLEERPWDKAIHGKHAFPWHGSRAKSPGVVDLHIYLEPIQVNGHPISGASLRSRVEKTANAEKVSGSTLALTFLWWVATAVHPPRDAWVRQTLKSMPPEAVDPRFKGFLKQNAS